ncbi:MAG: GNAT family N-acetyltransferase [Acidimicrobiia bacterium]
MKVAHLTTVDMSLRFLVLPQLTAVVEQGGEAVGISAPGPWVADLELAGVRHVPLPSSTRGVDVRSDLRAARELWRVLRRERPDVLHTHNPKPGLYGRALGRLAGVPVVVHTGHGLYATDSDPLLKRMVVYGLEALAGRFSDTELVQSSEDFHLVRRWRGARPTVLLGNGVDLTRFEPARFGEGRRGDLRHDLGIAEDQIVVGMVGRLVAEKGYPELFRAAALLDDRFVVLVIGPEDPEKPDALPAELIRGAETAGVRFLGMRDDVDELYLAMDLFVLPSHREGFPRAAMEAAAMGLPIVATDIRGCREVVEHGENGLLVPVGDVPALAAAISRLGEDRGLRATMAAAGYRRARERFDETEVVRKVMQAYRAAARCNGLYSLANQLGPSGESVLRPAILGDAPHLARLHRAAIEGGFLPRLGQRFMSRLYRALIGWGGSVVLVADDGAGPVGFVAGVEDVGAFYRHFARRFGPQAALMAAPALVRPSNLRRAWETWRYQGGDVPVPGELVAMAVAPEARGRGLGVRLSREFLAEMAATGADRVKVVVGASNRAALAAYAKAGFTPAGAVEIHAGEQSRVLVWSREQPPGW